MRDVLQELRGQYDHIVVDTPPTLSVTDAVVLSPRADAIVLVIRSGQTTKQALRRSRDILMQVNAKVSGVLLNAVDLSSPDYYYYYEYQGKYARYYHDDASHDDEDDDGDRGERRGFAQQRVVRNLGFFAAIPGREHGNTPQFCLAEKSSSSALPRRSVSSTFCWRGDFLLHRSSARSRNSQACNERFVLIPGMRTTAIIWAAITHWSHVIRPQRSSLTGPPCSSIRTLPATGLIWPLHTRCWETFPIRPLALEHAIQADPTTPDVAWEAANFYLVQGDEAKALREFRVVLQNEPTLADPAIQFCWRINPDVDALLARRRSRPLRGLHRVS